MFTKKKKVNGEEPSLLEKVEHTVKVSSPMVFHILTLIEILQMNYFLIHPQIQEYVWDTGFLDYYRQIIQYFQLGFILSNSTSGTFLTVMYICFAVNLIIIVLMVLSILNILDSSKKNSPLLGYGIKFLSTYALLMITILPLPVFQSYLATMICSSGYYLTAKLSCYSGLYQIHLTVAIIGFIKFLILCLVFSYLFIDMNPASNIPFAAPQSIMRLLKLALKLLLPLYATLDYNAKYVKLFVIGAVVYFLLILFYRLKTSSYYNKSVQHFTVFCESMVFWMSVCVALTVYMDEGTTDNIGMFYLVLSVPMVWNVFKLILHHRKLSFIHLSVKEFSNDIEAETYLLYLINQVEQLDIPSSRVELEGILRYHSKSCPRDTCFCRTLLVDETKDDEASLVLTKKWYQFIQSIIEDSLEKYPKSSRLHLLYSYVLHENLSNKFRALTELMVANELKCTVQENFSMHRFSNQIEEEIKESDEKNETRNVDVNKIVLFQKRYIEFQASIDKSVLLHLDFWRELIDLNPEIHKIENMGSKITATVEEVREQFRKLREIYSSHIKCMEIYGYFLKDIVNDDVEGEKILDNVKYAKNSMNVNKQFIDQERLKYGENSNTAIITVSGNLNQIGVVTNLNNELARILNWTKADVIDQNITKIMPQVYADIHDNLMRHYFETSQGTIIGIERTVLCQNKDQFLVPCTLMIKVLPNLEDGIQTVGFLKDIDDNAPVAGAKQSTSALDERVHYMIYRVDNDSFIMQGITQSCYESFGIPQSLMYGNNTNNTEFTVDSFCPELANLENLDNLRGPTGVVLTFDTTNLKSNYLFDDFDSDDEFAYEDDGHLSEQRSQQTGQAGTTPGNQESAEQNKNKQSKYRRARVRMNLIQEQIFEDRSVHVVRFVEVDEFDEGKSKLMQEGAQGSIMDQNNLREYEKGLGTRKNFQQHQQIDRDDEFNASDRESHVSNMSSTNDEVRKLKDFKSLISEKTVPQSISILKRTVLLLIAMIVALSSVELSMKISQQNEVSSGVQQIYLAYRRPNIMADISFYSRIISNIANTKRLPSTGYTVDTAIAFYQNYLEENVDLLQTNQFDNMKDILSLSSSTRDYLQNLLYDVQYQQQSSGDVKTYSNLLTDSMIQLITSASAIANSTQLEFVDTSLSPYVEPIIKHFYYVMTNGLFVLRKGTENESSVIYNYYYNTYEDYENTFRIILIVSIIVLVLSLGLLIPYVFKVHKTNNRVLSLFGMIHIAEIKELAARCESYSIQFIEDKMQNADASQPNMDPNEIEKEQAEHKSLKQEDEESNLEIDGELNENDVSKGEIDIQRLNEKRIARAQAGEAGNSKINQKQHGAATGNSDIKKGSHIKGEIEMGVRPSAISEAKGKESGIKSKDGKGGGAKPGDQKTAARTVELEDPENLRGQKLMNAKDNNRKKVIGQFFTFALVFIAYFVIGFVLELLFLQNTRKIMSHMQQVFQRNSIIKYSLIYMVEQITMDATQMEDGVNQLSRFIDLSYTIETQITSSSLESYPGSLDSYFSTFSTANYDNFCNIFPTTATLTLATCKTVNSGILEKGLKISITSYIEDIREIIANYVNNGLTSTATKQTLFASSSYTDLETMQFFMAPMIETLNISLKDAINSYLDTQGSIEKIKFGVFLASIIGIFIGVWMPYLEFLSQKIWRTKGMLNMIPMDIITKDENLKKEFQSGDIIQAVR